MASALSLPDKAKLFFSETLIKEAETVTTPWTMALKRVQELIEVQVFTTSSEALQSSDRHRFVSLVVTGTSSLKTFLHSEAYAILEERWAHRVVAGESFRAYQAECQEKIRPEIKEAARDLKDIFPLKMIMLDNLNEEETDVRTQVYSKITIHTRLGELASRVQLTGGIIWSGHLPLPMGPCFSFTFLLTSPLSPLYPAVLSPRFPFTPSTRSIRAPPQLAEWLVRSRIKAWRGKAIV